MELDVCEKIVEEMFLGEIVNIRREAYQEYLKNGQFTWTKNPKRQEIVKLARVLCYELFKEEGGVLSE